MQTLFSWDVVPLFAAPTLPTLCFYSGAESIYINKNRCSFLASVFAYDRLFYQFIHFLRNI